MIPIRLDKPMSLLKNFPTIDVQILDNVSKNTITNLESLVPSIYFSLYQKLEEDIWSR